MNDEMENWLFAFASANGRRVGYLEDLVTGEAIEKEIGKFIGSFHGTYEEMIRAVAYAAYGCGEVVAERTELAKKRFDEAQRWETSTDRERSNLAQLEAMIDRAAACTGLTMAEIKAQPISRLSAMIYFAHVKAGMQIDSSAARLHAEYLATLKSIRKRLEKERADDLTKSQVVET